jgi:hypothetical protein
MITDTRPEIYDVQIARLRRKVRERPKGCPVKGQAVSEKGRCSNER